MPLTGPWKGLRLQVDHPSPLSRVSAGPGRCTESLKSQVKEERDGPDELGEETGPRSWAALTLKT